MGTQVLGARRLRWIARVTGQPVERGIASGGYVFGFRTPGAPSGHRHGWIDLHAARQLPAHAQLPVEPGEVWGWEDPPVHWWSCGQSLASGTCSGPGT